MMDRNRRRAVGRKARRVVRPVLLGFAFATLIPFALSARDGTEMGGFSGDAETVAISGKFAIAASAAFGDLDDPGTIEAGNLFSGVVDVNASGDRVDALLRMKIPGELFENDPSRAIDEAFVRVTEGAFSLQGGLMKVTWGKADSRGPLDVVNPTDLTDLTVTEALDRKISRPMLRAIWSAGSMTRLEALLVTGFAGNRYASSGPWQPAAIAELNRSLTLLGYPGDGFSSLDAEKPGLGDFQAGCRFATTSRSVDWGVQYYYGRMAEPSVVFAPPSTFAVTHDRFHQAGADCAFVLAGFNVRGEGAVFLTDDIEGDDPAVRNAEVEFSAGFDREITGNLKLNIQYAGGYLFNTGSISSPLDVQDGDRAYTSALTAKLSRGFLKDTLTLDLTVLWGIDDGDYLAIPRVSYAIGDASLALSAGVFGGNRKGELGQFHDASYVKAEIVYAY